MEPGMPATDSSSLPPIAVPPPRIPSAKTHRPISKQFVRGASAASSDDDTLSESDAMQTEAMADSMSSGDNLTASQQEKMQLFAMSPDLELLCRENGLSASQFARNSESVKSLDVFLGFWTSMRSVMYFPALRELAIINQPTICELEGLSSCTNLEKLCITECGLTKIAILDNCTKLKALNLSSNKIRRLENLDALVNLETLWINQNQLERLDGMWRLTNLKQLWACRNRIDRIDTALNCCVNLMELNLADNRLSNFKGLLSLTNLDQLVVLVLNDPHFGDNPVCRLCNYQTYLMCQLPRLNFLDTAELSARNKQIAEATMIKKKMYYNMRIKAIKRDVHGRTRHAENIRNQAEHHMESSVSALVRHKKEIERFLIENGSGKGEIVESTSKVSQEKLNALEKKLESINSCLRDRYCAVYRMNQDFDRLRISLRCTSEINIARLMLELETGGNIRLEDGKPADAWFGSCVELVRSRCFLPDLQKFGINDIQINRITRINNRFLRNRFQARIEEVLVAPDKKIKDNVSKKGVTVPNEDIDVERESENLTEQSSNLQPEQSNQPQNPCPGSTLETSMEYLFYTQSSLLEDHQLRSPADSDQLFIAENGFRGFSGLGMTDFGAAIKLSNSIALLDSPRVAAALIAKGQQAQSNAGTPPSAQQGLMQDMKRASQLAATGEWDLPCAVLLVAKVFPGYTKCISNADIALAKATSSLTVNKAQDFSGVQSLQVMHGGAATTTAGGEVTANKQKLYYVFDSALVLPEYFVEYQYVFDNDTRCPSRGGSTSQAGSRSTKSPVHCNEEDIVNLGAATKLVDDFERKYRIRRSQSPSLPTDNSVYSSTDESVVQLLQMEPMLPGTSTSNESTAAFMALSRLQAAKANRIKHLSLLGCDLAAIPDLSPLRDHLEVLVLSYNKIQGMFSNLETLSKLQSLDLSYNHIARIGHLEHLYSLESLEVTHNLIKSFDDVECLGQTLGKSALTRLDLRKNSICESKRYRFHVLQYLPELVQLDQQTVSQEEIAVAQQLITQLTPSKVWALHCQKTRCTVPLSASEAATAQQSDRHPESDDEVDCNSMSDTAEWSSVEELILNHELLGSIEGLSKAVNLRIASFSDNAIKRINGLQACTRLEELCLDDNEIKQIENLEKLSFLKKLHLGRNRLTVIQHLDSLGNLIQLSLEENQISSLRGLGSALKLMELYLGNNKIENLKEIQHLKSLPKLTILDLSGNEITRVTDYRLYSVYYLRRVKVLDGLSVSTQDQSNAKQKYSGKLTLEFILEKCGGGNATPSGPGGENHFGRISDMNLSSCRIREIGSIPGDVFSNVREINLENNQISDISGLVALPKLRILNLNRNRIEKLMVSSSISADYTLPDACDGGGKGILACLNLEQLHLAYNQITDMTTLGLQFLDSLKVLHLQGNAIVYFAGLDTNTELVDIRLDKNRIRQLDPHSTLALRYLKTLNLEDNGLKSLSNFTNMLSLETLELSNNRLVDLEEVEKLAALPSLVDMRLINNPLTKKHLYRQHVLYKLSSLKMLDGKDVYSDEKERIDILFLHERAAAAIPGANPTAPERTIENRAMYQTHLVLTPSSIPSKNSAAASQQPSIPHNEVLAGSLLRKTSATPLAHGQLLSAPTFPLPDHEVDLSIVITPSNTVSRSLPVPVNRNLTSLGGQSSWQLGTSTPSATVASALGANLAKSVGAEQAYLGSSLRRRLSPSVHYDQQQNGSPSLQVNGKFGGTPDVKLPVGIVSSHAVVRSPAAVIRRAGFNMNPSSAEPQHKLSTQTSTDYANSTGSGPNTPGRNFSGYVVTYGNQKRYSNYPGSQQETTIPYLSTKVQQQSRRSSDRK